MITIDFQMGVFKGGQEIQISRPQVIYRFIEIAEYCDRLPVSGNDQ
jgi:hypothetical protein